jgi:hypothetical protein
MSNIKNNMFDMCDWLLSEDCFFSDYDVYKTQNVAVVADDGVTTFYYLGNASMTNDPLFYSAEYTRWVDGQAAKQCTCDIKALFDGNFDGTCPHHNKQGASIWN